MLAAPALLALLCATDPAAAPAPDPAPDPAPPAAISPPKSYGDQGTFHLGLGLGSGSRGFQYAAGIESGYFVLPGVAPGIDLAVSGGKGLLATGLALGTLRLVPVRARGFSLYVVGRAGRVLLSGHPDGWGAGGGADVLVFGSGRVGLQIAYDVLKLTPASFCADLASGCTLQGLALGIVAGL